LRVDAFFRSKFAIYDLPIVMNYGVMYEYAVDKNNKKTQL